MGQYPNPEDIAAVQKGLAAGPVGQPLKASEMVWPPQ
jgi:penicillin-binding protein 2